MYVGTGRSVMRFSQDTRPLPELFQDAIERSVFCEELGYDFIVMGEHHFMANQWNPSPLMALAAVASRTSRIRLGTNVLLTPLYNPLRLAEDVAVLDNLSNGRVELVCGSASITGEFDTYGIPPETRFGRVWEVMGFLRRAFSEDQFDHEGRYYQFPNVRLTTKPVQQPFPLWFGGFGPKMCARAGRLGYQLFGSARAPGDVYEEGLRLSGLKPDDFNRGVGFGPVAVVVNEQERAEIEEQVMAEARAHNEEYNESGRDLAFQNIRSGSQQPIIGTPDQVLKALEPHLKDSNLTHMHVQNRDRRRLELFAKEVMPTIKTWGRTPVRGMPTAV